MAEKFNYIIPDTLSIDEQVVRWIQQQLIDAPFNPDNDDGTKLFQEVIRGKIDDINAMMLPGCAIEEGPEKQFDELWPVTEQTLRIYVNFKIQSDMGTNQGEVGVDQFVYVRYYFARITKILVTPDQYIGGLATDVQPIGNTPEVNGRNDRQPGGTVILDIRYRHMFGDKFTGI